MKCSRCNEERTLEEMVWGKRDGYKTYCKKCKNTNRRKGRYSYVERRNMIAQGIKSCTMCHVIQPLSNFYSHSHSEDGLRYRCKKCVSGTNKSIKYRKYNMTEEDYGQMFIIQNYKCKICEKIFNDGDKRNLRPTIDHCHITGYVRGLLCSKCNKGIDHLEDDITILENAINYLKESKDENNTYRKRAFKCPI